MMVFKMYLLSNMAIVGIYVSFRGCNFFKMDGLNMGSWSMYGGHLQLTLPKTNRLWNPAVWPKRKVDGERIRPFPGIHFVEGELDIVLGRVFTYIWYLATFAARWFKVTFWSPIVGGRLISEKVTFSPSQKGHDLNHLVA